MKILISGLCGHMGKEVAKLALEGKRGVESAFGVDAFMDNSPPVPCVKSFAEAPADVDCVIDFSHHSNTGALLEFAVSHRLPLVLATTGQTEEEKEMIFSAAEKIPLFFAANYSLGVALLIELAKKAAAMMPDAEIEIIEAHHDRKIDAPSGTALAIADAIQTVRPGTSLKCGRNGQEKRTREEIGIHSVRMGNIVGMHEVLIGTETQTITLKHEAHSRGLFAEGALAAAEFLIGKPIGLYNMKSMVQF
ncbi:MAG: 4-hydroxy-tetrahydrodipicolinate reductase [Clostridia bacterium]|nr:4-hydroxy-tetrahydrodipicolinate reductase [Clostridia bacterium]